MIHCYILLPPEKPSKDYFEWHYNKPMEEAKKRGRPPKPEGEKLERLTLFVPRPIKEKVEQFGQEWARVALKRAKPPR